MSDNNRIPLLSWAPASTTNLLSRCFSATQRGTVTPEEKARNELLKRKKSVARSIAKVEKEEHEKVLKKQRVKDKWAREMAEVKRKMDREGHKTLADFPQSKLQMKIQDMERWMKMKLGL